MRKSIITSVLASVLLSGCGSGGSDRSDSGSGSSSTPTTKYTLQFVQLVEEVEGSATSCTLFDITGQSVGMQTYARLASDVRVKTYDADGNFNKDLSDLVSNTGVLNITERDIEDGGYLSVIDSPSDKDPLYKVLSIQKELLGNYLISVGRSQRVDTCYESGKARTSEVGYPLRTSNIDLDSADAYDYETSHSSTVAKLSREVTLEAYTDEKILEKAYYLDSLVGYTFIPELTDTPEFANDIKIIKVDETLNFNVFTGPNELNSLAIKIGNGDFTYPWYSVNLASDITFPYASIEPSWSFKRNGLISNELDIKLPDSLYLSDTAPAVSQLGNSFIFKNASFDTAGVNIQRSFYIQNGYVSSRFTELNHSIYSVSDGSGNVVIPDLELINLDPLNPIAVEVSVLAMDTLQKDTVASFMRDEHSGDFVSIVLKPEDRIKHNKAINMNDYTIIER